MIINYLLLGILHSFDTINVKLRSRSNNTSILFQLWRSVKQWFVDACVKEKNERLGDTKWVIKSRKSKDIQWQKKKGKKTKNDIQNTIQKIKGWGILTAQKPGWTHVLRKRSSSWSISSKMCYGLLKNNNSM